MDTAVAALQTLFLQQRTPTMLGSVLSVSLVAVAYWLIFALARPLMFVLAPSLRKKSRKDQLGAFIRIPSLVNCFIEVPLGLYLLRNDAALRADHIFGQSAGGNLLSLLAAGYFLFDITHSFYDYQGALFLVHAVLCTFVYSGALRPFLQYYACVYLFFEASTVFLNLLWFVKYVAELPDSHPLHRGLGVAFAVTFFVSRIVFGNYFTYYFLHDMWRFSATPAGSSMHVVSLLYILISAILTILNLYWFWRIIAVILMGQKFSKEEIAGKDK